MKFFKGTLIILCLLFFLNVSLVSASFETTVNLIEDNEGTFNKITGDDLTLSYQFNTGEKIEKDIKSSQPLTIDFNHELFCFEDCNVIPKRIIYRTEIRKNYDLISGIDGKNADFSKNSLINVYLTEKINSKYEGLKNFQTPQEAVLNENDKFVSWNGVIVIDEEANYSFYLNITGKAKVSINNETVFDNINSDSLENNTFNSLLENGNYTLSLEYWSNIDSKPNLFYATTENKDYKVIPEDKLKFINGFVKEYQSNKGMRAFSASSFPESYPIDYSTYPTAVMGYYSLNSQRTPLLLIHGLHGSDSIDTGDTSTWNYWNNIPSELIDYNYDVWELYYIPANVSNFMTSGLLKNEINEVLSHYSVSKLDVVSHSMGGFVTLGYIEGLGKSSSGASVPYDNNIRKYIIIASPLHGAFSANRVLMDIAPASYGCNWLANLLGISPDDEYAQAYLDLAVGSEFTWLLNKNALNSQINYLVITGNQGIPCVPDETKESNSGDSGAGNDGLVAVSSASLLDKNIPLVILGNYNHANEKGNDYTGFFTVNVQKEVDIIDYFNKGNGVQAKKYNLGSADYNIDPQDTRSNTFNPATTVLKINSNQNVK
ncbi:MAG: PA14 domain-containing protein [Candidatus Pacearchaeota archaeon]|nr:PA14 domain-containing protein [Candidatus Pacearchaeota archaeon]